MAFKTNTFAQTASVNPAAHFKTLTKRQFPDVMPHVRYWALNDHITWVNHSIGVLRQLKGTFPGEGDLLRRDEAYQRLEAEGLTLQTVVERLPMATDAMTIIP